MREASVPLNDLEWAFSWVKKGKIMLKAYLVLITLVLTCSNFSHACITQAEFKFDDISLADSVFVGELVKYDVVKPNQEYDLSVYAIITFSVGEYLKGKPKEGKLEVYWHNSTFSLPSKLKNDRYLVAITFNEQPPLRGPSATIFASARPDLPSVLQAPCADPFLLKFNKKTWNEQSNYCEK